MSGNDVSLHVDGTDAALDAAADVAPLMSHPAPAARPAANTADPGPRIRGSRRGRRPSTRRVGAPARGPVSEAPGRALARAVAQKTSGGLAVSPPAHPGARQELTRPACPGKGAGRPSGLAPACPPGKTDHTTAPSGLAQACAPGRKDLDQPSARPALARAGGPVPWSSWAGRAPSRQAVDLLLEPRPIIRPAIGPVLRGRPGSS
jgi:hypothetical protein